MHLWYGNRFGYDIEPYISAEDAISTYPTSATAIGVKLENDILKVYAPFGLNDLFGMVVRPNKTKIAREVYYGKVDKWTEKWSNLKVFEW